eukprot:5434889-Pyramimonas_sp.AAC.1
MTKVRPCGHCADWCTVCTGAGVHVGGRDRRAAGAPARVLGAGPAPSGGAGAQPSQTGAPPSLNPPL